VYDNKSQLEVLQHSHDVLALAWRPDGKQLASSTLDGQIYFWNAQVMRCCGLLCFVRCVVSAT
jgi:periodic tryptophan protein 2